MAEGEKIDRSGGGSDVRDADDDATFQGRSGAGDSGGGAYSNPHSRKKALNDGFMGHGGQSDMGYHGQGRLGARETGGNRNAPSKESED